MPWAHSLPALLLRAAFLSPSAWTLLLGDGRLWRVGVPLVALSAISGVLGRSIGRHFAWEELAGNLAIGIAIALVGWLLVGFLVHLIADIIGPGRGSIGTILGTVGVAHATGLVQLAMVWTDWTFGIWAIATVWAPLTAAVGVGYAARTSLVFSLLAVLPPWIIWALLQLVVWTALGAAFS